MFGLNDDELKVMETFGKVEISQNKNVEFHTIRKRLPLKYHEFKKNYRWINH